MGFGTELRQINLCPRWLKWLRFDFAVELVLDQRECAEAGIEGPVALALYRFRGWSWRRNAPAKGRQWVYKNFPKMSDLYHEYENHFVKEIA